MAIIFTNKVVETAALQMIEDHGLKFGCSSEEIYEMKRLKIIGKNILVPNNDKNLIQAWKKIAENMRKELDSLEQSIKFMEAFPNVETETVEIPNSEFKG